MQIQDRNGTHKGTIDPRSNAKRTIAAAERGMRDDQLAADADHLATVVDQTLADADRSASAAEQAGASADRRADDHDGRVADRTRTAGPMSVAGARAYETSRSKRETVAIERLGDRLKRAGTARERDAKASQRDRNADARDAAGRARDRHARAVARGALVPDQILLARLEELAAEAAADRATAARDRARAAADRATATRERAKLEVELHHSHLDELTGAFRREMGRLALVNEIERARRSGGQFVLAFVDVDGLKAVNDGDGHAAGDHVLRTVVLEIRRRLRSFDPIIRHGGDEFVCGVGGTNLTEARRRFDEIRAAIETEVHVTISVGLAALTDGETVDQLTKRADVAMIRIRGRERSRS